MISTQGSQLTPGPEGRDPCHLQGILWSMWDAPKCQDHMERQDLDQVDLHNHVGEPEMS